VLLPKGDDLVLGKVISRKRDADGNPIGTGPSNPIFDTRSYQVLFPGQVEEYSANIMAQNLNSQIDNEGHRYVFNG
jgi:hypothetical protein